MDQETSRMMGMLVETTINGEDIRFFVINQNDIIQKHHVHGLFYEAEELSLISKYISKETKYLDIGANIGNHIIYLGKILGLQNMTAIEPNPLAISILKTNIRLNELTNCVDLSYLGFGLSDQPGKAVISFSQNNLGGARLISKNEENSQNTAVDIRTVDELLSGLTFDFIKIDVEGMEIKCLHGMASLIEQCRPTIFIEVDNINAKDFEVWCVENKYSVVEKYKRYSMNENYLIAAS